MEKQNLEELKTVLKYLMMVYEGEVTSLCDLFSSVFCLARVDWFVVLLPSCIPLFLSRLISIGVCSVLLLFVFDWSNQNFKIKLSGLQVSSCMPEQKPYRSMCVQTKQNQITEISKLTHIFTSVK